MNSKINNNDDNNSWPDQISTTPVSNHNNQKDVEKCSGKTCNKKSCANNNSHISSALTISIASFNILAESYLSPRSHPKLPDEYASVVFDPIQRRDLLLKTLEKLILCSWTGSTKSSKDSTLDILCLQEVDMYDDLIEPFMTKHGYDSFKSNNSHKKVDSCAIFWKKDAFECIKKRTLDFDDLATLELSTASDGAESRDKTKNEISEENDFDDESDPCYGQPAPSWDSYINTYPTNPKTYYNKKKKKTQYRKQKSPSSLTGILQSFSRRNTSCLLLLKPKHQSRQKDLPVFAVACAHLYWNPGYEYVKLAQSKYLMKELNSFANTKSSGSGEVPVVICGDMNSKPGSIVHRFYLEGNGVDARKSAPWFTYLSESSDDDESDSKSNECNKIGKCSGSDESHNKVKQCMSHQQKIADKTNKMPNCCNGNSKRSMNEKKGKKCNDSSCKKNSCTIKSDSDMYKSNPETCCEKKTCCGENESKSRLKLSTDYRERKSCKTSGMSESCNDSACCISDGKEEIYNDPNNQKCNDECCEKESKSCMETSKCCIDDEQEKYEIDRVGHNHIISDRKDKESSNEQCIGSHTIPIIAKTITDHQRGICDGTHEVHDCCHGDSKCHSAKMEGICDDSTHTMNSCYEQCDTHSCERHLSLCADETCCNDEIQIEANICLNHHNSVADTTKINNDCGNHSEKGTESAKCGASDEMQLETNKYEHNQHNITETTDKMEALSIDNYECSNTKCCKINESQTKAITFTDQQITPDKKDEKHGCCNGSFDCESNKKEDTVNKFPNLEVSNDDECKSKSKKCNDSALNCGLDVSYTEVNTCSNKHFATNSPDEKYECCNGSPEYACDTMGGKESSGSDCENHSMECGERKTNISQKVASTGANHQPNVTNTTHAMNDCCNGSSECSSGAKMENNNENKKNRKNRQIRYLLDFSLNKFTRWLRMLGIDAELETEEEEEERTRSLARRIILFERCQKENRILITTSYKLLERKGCPAGAYFINPTTQTMEQSLCHLLISHGVKLYPDQFLERCVRCNHSFREVTNPEEKRIIFERNHAPLLMDLSVQECIGCGQGYWWGENPGSASSRVKNHVTKLFRLVLRAGVEYEGPLGIFDFIDVKKEIEYGKKIGFSKDVISAAGGHIEALSWLKEKNLTHSFKLKSIYEREQNDDMKDDLSKNLQHMEMLPFTNVTHDFVDTLDYIFYDSEKWTLKRRLIVPTSFKEMNKTYVKDGHLLPSRYWPSDHLAIGGQLELKPQSFLSNCASIDCKSSCEKSCDNHHKSSCNKKKSTCQSEISCNREKFRTGNTLAGLTRTDDSECSCCVPNRILTYFEMVELRKKFLEKQNLLNSRKLNV